MAPDEQVIHQAEAQPPQEPAPGRAEVYDRSWLTALLRPLLIVTMMLCVTVVLGAVLARLASDLPAGFATGLMVIAGAAAVVAVVSTTVLAQPSQRINRSLAYRAAELGLFLAVTRVFVWVAGAGTPTLLTMVRRPIDTLLDPLFMGCALIVFVSWWIASEITDTLNQLALQGDELRSAQLHSDRSGDTMRAAGVDRRSVLADFMVRWVTFGLLLILLAALMRRGISFHGFFAILRQDIEPQIMASVIIYFLCGLLLLSHGQLALLRARWTLEKTPSSDDVPRRWPLQVVAVIGGLALAALFMPFGGTFLLATILSVVIGGLFGLMMTLYRLLAYGFIWLLSALAGDTPPPPPTVTPTPLPSEPYTAARPLDSPLPDWLGGAFFWLLVVLLVAYAALIYFRDKGFTFKWLELFWQMLRARWTEAARVLRSGRQRQPVEHGDAHSPRKRWEWLRRSYTDPDQQVRYLYLSALHEAEEAGLPRLPAETPLHYAPRLEGELAAPTGSEQRAPVDPAVRELTSAFVEVRYAGLRASPERAAALRAQWQKLQQTLRQHRSDSETAATSRPESAPPESSSRGAGPLP